MRAEMAGIALLGRPEMILEKNETFTVTEAMIPPQMSVTIDDAREAVRIFADLRMRYQGAIKEISTKLEVLDNEFSVKHDYNPIHHMTSRIKSVDSIFEKIKLKRTADGNGIGIQGNGFCRCAGNM